MPTNLTGSAINATYGQLLHVSDGVVAEERIVRTGTGVATALKVGTTSISATFSALTLLDPAQARGELELGSMATQDANAVNITGGSIADVVFTGSFTGISLIESDKFSTKNGSNGVSIESNSIFAEGVSANIGISITPKGTGAVSVSNINVLSGAVPFNTITNRAYAAFYDAGTVDQTGSITNRTAVRWGTASVVGAGVTVASDSRITLAAAGTYRINANLQFVNAENASHQVIVWFAKNGTDIASSASKIVVPSSSTGGTAVFAIEIFETVAANDYIEMYWLPDDLDVKLHYIAPVAAVPGVTPAIPAVPPAIVVVERIA